MAFRRPLYESGGNLIEMNDTQINEIRSQVAYLYSLDPSVTLSVVGSGGNLGTYSDTRRTAGSFLSFTTRFPTEGETAEPGTATINYSRLNEAVASTSQPADTSSLAFPAFSNSGNIQAMTATDMYDTFITPAISTLVSGSTGTAQAGTYFISSSTSVGGATLISGTPVFSDTRANTGLYTAGGIPEALDQPFTVTNYYLHRINGSATAYTTPIFIRSADANLQVFSSATFNSQLQGFIRHAASAVGGIRVRYSINGSGNNRGTGMANTVLNGSGNYQVLFVNQDDYRAQEFPDGSVVTANTYFLRIFSV